MATSSNDLKKKRNKHCGSA